MKKNLTCLTLLLCSMFTQHKLSAQTVINGSFESTTAACDYNLPNSTFTTMMSDCFAFGSNSQLDIVNSTCGYGTAQQGNYFIGMAVDLTNTLTDALSLKLSTALITGNTYLLSFYNKKDPAYAANLIEIGYSTDSLNFGNSIDTAQLPGTTWELFSVSFTPLVNSQYLTMRTIAGAYGWNFIDNIDISITTSLASTPAQMPVATVFPNPTTGIINIGTHNDNQLITARVKDMQGRTLLVTNQNRIDISAYGTGMFILELTTNNGKIIERIVHN